MTGFDAFSSVAALSAGLQSRAFSAPELTQAYLDRIAALNDRLNAYITVCADEAMRQAEAAQRRIDAGQADALTGIPLGIKDNICTSGVRTTCASRMLETFVPPYDATVIARLKAQDAVLLGKLNMDEFAMGGSSQTSYFGGVKNPYDTSRVPGGSSGGSAAAVAAGLCAASLGSDTGGSIRQPAAFCGVTGLKPTYGAVSRYGLVAFASSLDQIGPIARTARDCALLLSAVAGRDENDGTSRALPDVDYLARVGMSLRDVTIGLPQEFFEDYVSEEVRAAVQAAAEHFRSLGATLKTVSLPSLRYAVASYYLISSAEAASNLSRYDGIKYGYRAQTGETYEELIKNTRREGFGSEVKRRIVLGNYALSSGYYDAYYNRAVQIRGRIREEYAALLRECDCILTPTAPTVSYPIGQQENDPVRMYSADICSVTANIAGLPALSTPCGYNAQGLPIGMCLTGRAFDEATLIALADAFESDFSRREAQL